MKIRRENRRINFLIRICTMRRKTVILFILSVIAGFIEIASAQSQRRFVHPGITYTQGDFDRMKAMVEARQEPYYSTFLKLKESSYSSLDAPVVNRGEQIQGGCFNATIGVDGRRAHDLALLWHLTGDEAYARKAVEYLNANSFYINTSSRGTGPLDNGKIYLLIDAAEMMRDYSDWKPEDQQRFKDMLVHPGYSNTEDFSAKYANYWDDSKNGVTFYWNIYNFDAARFGNQGLFAARSMMAMAIYLDNENVDISGKSNDVEKKVNLSELLPDGLKLTSGSSTDLWITVNILPEGSKIYSFPTEDIKVKGLPDDLQLAFEVADIELKVQAEEGDLSQFDLKSVGAVLSMDDWEEGSYEVPIKISLPEGYKLLEDVTAEIKISKVSNVDSSSQ